MLAGSQPDLCRISFEFQPDLSWISAGSRPSRSPAGPQPDAAGSQPDVIMTSAGSQPDPSQITAGSQPDPGQIFRLKRCHIHASGAENGSGCRISTRSPRKQRQKPEIFEETPGEIHHFRSPGCFMSGGLRQFYGSNGVEFRRLGPRTGQDEGVR